jgi:hypothetical protein
VAIVTFAVGGVVDWPLALLMAVGAAGRRGAGRARGPPHAAGAGAAPRGGDRLRERALAVGARVSAPIGRRPCGPPQRAAGASTVRARVTDSTAGREYLSGK